MMKEVKDKRFLVVGGGISGISVALLLNRNGAYVFLTESDTMTKKHQQSLDKYNIQYEQQGHTDKVYNYDYVVVSPSIPKEHTIIKYYQEHNKSVFSEIEVASWFNKGQIVGVTGTNGKTTVTKWLEDIWKLSKIPYHLGGNIGIPFSSFADKTTENEWILLEVSSFQLEYIESFYPKIAVLLNIYEDHLDYYDGDMAHYAETKCKIVANDKTSCFIYNNDDPLIERFIREYNIHCPYMLSYTFNRQKMDGAYIDNQRMYFFFNDTPIELMKINQISLSGKHNIQNAMASALVAHVANIKDSFIRKSLMSFEGVEHRLEHVKTVDGITYINDSKATNINAVWYALDSCPKTRVLILGGRGKGNDYMKLYEQLVDKVHSIIAIGEDQDIIYKQLKNVVPVLVKAKTLEEAIELSLKYAYSGDTVLFSPGCSSYDMFDNYEDRGKQFVDLIYNIKA